MRRSVALPVADLVTQLARLARAVAHLLGAILQSQTYLMVAMVTQRRQEQADMANASVIILAPARSVARGSRNSHTPSRRPPSLQPVADPTRQCSKLQITAVYWPRNFHRRPAKLLTALSSLQASSHQRGIRERRTQAPHGSCLCTVQGTRVVPGDGLKSFRTCGGSGSHSHQKSRA